jgi:omega-amidase
MRLTLIQSSLHWEQPEANCRMFSEKLAPLAGLTDLVVLPEMFSTGFSMRSADLAETMDGPTVAWMAATARQLDAAVTGSLICRDDGRYYNRLVWMFPDGKVETYDKHNLFGLAGEDRHFSPGEGRLVVEWRGWRICPRICYDLRFPEWGRNHLPEPYDLLLYVANWPSRRSSHWRSLLQARAIENQAYTLGVNIVGADGAGLEYSGDSSLIDFYGNVLFHLSGQEGIFTAAIDREAQEHYRAQLPFLTIL